MTVNKAKEILENAEYIYGGSDSIYSGITLLKEFSKDECFEYSAEHDQIWVGARDFDDYVDVMSDMDVEYMGRCGWFEDMNRWSHFV